MLLAADEALQALLGETPAPRCMRLLLPSLPASDEVAAERAAAAGAAAATSEAAVLQAAIRNLARTIGRLGRASAQSFLPEILSGLFVSFRHASADVRKAVVFCLVDLWLVRSAPPPPQAKRSSCQNWTIVIFVLVLSGWYARLNWLFALTG